jgi:hypothetical protein
MDTNEATIEVFVDSRGSESGIHLPGAAVIELQEQPAAQGERRLLAVLLGDAVSCYRKYAFSGTRRGRRLFREAEAWFMDPHLDAAIPFQYVCEVLGIEPDYLRSALERWRAESYTGSAVSAAASRPYNREPGRNQGAVWPKAGVRAGLGTCRRNTGLPASWFRRSA